MKINEAIFEYQELLNKIEILENKKKKLYDIICEEQDEISMVLENELSNIIDDDKKIRLFNIINVNSFDDELGLIVIFELDIFVFKYFHKYSLMEIKTKPTNNSLDINITDRLIFDLKKGIERVINNYVLNKE